MAKQKSSSKKTIIIILIIIAVAGIMCIPNFKLVHPASHENDWYTGCSKDIAEVTQALKEYNSVNPNEPINESADEAEDGLTAEEQPSTGNDAPVVEDQPLVEISMSETIIEEPVAENDEAEEAPEEPISDIILPGIEELLDEVAPAA